MQEQEIMVPSTGDVVIQTRMYANSSTDCVVICHPHPQYGGNMHNNVVITARDAAATRGWSTIRFNFRGVGKSTGGFKHGLGEKDDLINVVCYVQNSMPGIGIHLVGYSFGAWVALKATGCGVEPRELVLISPPLDFMDFNTLSLPACPCSIIVGDQDEYCSSTSLTKWIYAQSARDIAIKSYQLAGGDHFYTGKEHDLFDGLKNLFASRFIDT